MTKFTNSKASSFLKDLGKLCSLYDDNNFTRRCKFNFSFFDVQDCSQDFCDWSPEQLHKLFAKLKNYSLESIERWEKEKIGSHGKVLAIYDEFPKSTDFSRPKHVPHQVKWGRFRLESAVRLIGFVIPSEFENSLHPVTKERFDRNTFYVVYLDKDHRFYKTEKK
jgi:hypothetical protein